MALASAVAAAPPPALASSVATRDVGIATHLCMSIELESIATARAMWLQNRPCAARATHAASGPRKSRPTRARDRPQCIAASTSVPSVLPSWTLHGAVAWVRRRAGQPRM